MTLSQQIERGMEYTDFVALMEKQAADKSAGEMQAFVDLNAHRTRRLLKTHKPSDELLTAVRRIKRPQTWLVLTEPWCGDSAWSLPIISLLAESNPQITLRIVLRDTNPEVMQLYLTNGKMSIPKFVAFAEDGRELFRWGPRPEQAGKLYQSLRAENLPHEEIEEKLHLWYGRDRGQAIEAELLALLKGL